MENSATQPAHLTNGGRLRVGGKPGNKGGTGRPPNELRAGFRQKLPAELRALQRQVKKLEKLLAESENVYHIERLINARARVVEFLAKYGVGTTITETDTEGRDAPRPFTFRINSPRDGDDN